MEQKPQDVVDTAKKAVKPAINDINPVITDMNLTVATMLMSGKRNVDIARELGISAPAVTQHVKRFRELAGLKVDGTIADPINNQRARLTKRLKKTDTVIGHALRDYGISDRLSINASNVALAVNKGLGVLVDKTEVSGQVDLLAQRRDDMRARIEAMRQFGLTPVDAEVEVLEDQPDVSRETLKQPANKPQISQPDAPDVDGKAQIDAVKAEDRPAPDAI